MKKIILIVLAVVVVGVIVSKVRNREAEVSDSGKPTVRIGVSLPLSGGVGNVGESLRNAILLAKEDLAQRELKNNYEFIIDDDAFELKRATTVFNKQKSLDKVDALMGFSSTFGNIIAPLAEQSKTVYFNIAASDPRVVEGKYSFVHWTMPSETARKILEHQQKRGDKRIAVIAGNDTGVLVLVKEYEKLAPEFGIEFHTTIFQPNERDFRMLLAKTKSYNPDACLALIFGNNISPFIKQYYESGIAKPLHNIETLSMVDDAALIEGVYYSDAALSSATFLGRLKEKFPNNPTDFGTGNAYDAVMILVQAFENAETKEGVVDELIKIKEYDGVTGLAVQDEHGVFRCGATLRKGEGGKIVVVEE